MNKHNFATHHLIMLIVSISLGFQVNLTAQDKRVSMKDKREEFLSVADQLLNPGNPELVKRFETVSNPFEPYIEPIVEPDLEPLTKVQTKQFDEKLVLRRVVKMLKPKGSLILGETRILILEGRKKLREGDIIPAKISGKIYKIQITEITGRNFTLSLNQSKLTSGFQLASSRGKVTLNKASN